MRTAPTSRLLGVVLGVLVTIVAGTAIALAAIGIGPVPRHESLARAIHQGLAARAPNGVYARITFTNNLIESGEIQGSDPLLTGGTGRLWWTGTHLRLEIQGDNGDAQVVVNGRSFWAYDPALQTVYQGTLPPVLADHRATRRGERADQALPSVSAIQASLNRLAGHLLLSGAIPTNVGGEPAYSVRITPRHDNGLLGTVELAWDALRRAPLRISLYARGNSNPVLALTASDISFGPQPSSVFDIRPPASARVVKLMSQQGPAGAARGRGRRIRSVSGLSAVAREVPFNLSAPARLAGRPRTSVRLLSLGGHSAALLTYGHGLGAVAVVENSSRRARPLQTPPSGDRPGLLLPTVSIRGISGQELQTAIGTVVRFTRAGVAYTVLGSVPGSVADAAARGL